LIAINFVTMEQQNFSYRTLERLCRVQAALSGYEPAKRELEKDGRRISGHGRSPNETGTTVRPPQVGCVVTGCNGGVKGTLAR
jgi:hypothetical protein